MKFLNKSYILTKIFLIFPKIFLNLFTLISEKYNFLKIKS